MRRFNEILQETPWIGAGGGSMSLVGSLFLGLKGVFCFIARKTDRFPVFQYNTVKKAVFAINVFSANQTCAYKFSHDRFPIQTVYTIMALMFAIP